jgi:molybdate transport system substrate-binding protein
MGSVMKHLFCAALLLGTSAGTRGQTVEVTLIAPGGIRAAIEQLIPQFEAKTTYKVKATFGSGLGTRQQVTRGDAFDVPIVQPPYPEVLASGNVVTTSARILASVKVGVAVRKGAPKPDLSTPAAVERTLLNAKSVSYPDSKGGAAAGVSFEAMLKKLGIAEKMEPHLMRAQGGAAAMQAVAKGEAEIGVTFLSEMNEAGIDAVGPFPVSISTPTVLVGFVSAHAKNLAAAQALLDFLASPGAGAAYRAQKMDPGQ